MTSEMPRLVQRILEDPRKRTILFRLIWLSSLGMLVLGYLIIVWLLV